MGRSVEVVVSELQAAAERLRDAGQRMQDGLSGVDLETRQLLGSGWKGDAASAYGPAWDQWHTGAGQVIRGLQTMADLLNLAGREYAKTDEQSGEALNATMRGGGGAPRGGGGGGSVPGAAGGTKSAPPAPVADLAQQMDLDQLSSAGQAAGSVPGQLSGVLAQATQMAGEVAGQVTSMVEGAVQSGQEPPEPPDRASEDRAR